MNIVQLLQDRAASDPDRTALIQSDKNNDTRISYGQLNDRVAGAVHFFANQGLNRGDYVLFYQPMSISLYVHLLACFQFGLVAVFIDPAMGRNYIEACCRICSPRALIATSRAHLLRLASKTLRKIPVKFSTGSWLPGARLARWQKYSGKNTDLCEGGDNIALISFTSGSTETPKAVARSHRFLLTQNTVLRQSLLLKEGEIDINSLPVFVLANLAAGLTTIIPAIDPRHIDLEGGKALLRQIQQHRPQRLSVSPSVIAALTSACQLGRTQLDWTFAVYAGGAPVFPRLMDNFAQVAPRANIHAVYGSSEAEPIAHIEYNDLSAADMSAMREGKGLLCGKIIADLDLRIIASQPDMSIGALDQRQFQSISLPTGQAGEIVVHGLHVLQGYFDGVGDSETKFSVEDRIWHRTGDIGYLDEHQRVWLLGRQNAIVSDRWGTEYPFGIECAALQFPAIRQAAFISHRGKRYLVVETDTSFDIHQLDGLRQRHHIPDILRIRVMPLDRRHHAKIDYPALQQRLNKVNSFCPWRITKISIKSSN